LTALTVVLLQQLWGCGLVTHKLHVVHR
jgi:hypothetical protein